MLDEWMLCESEFAEDGKDWIVLNFDGTDDNEAADVDTTSNDEAVDPHVLNGASVASVAPAVASAPELLSAPPLTVVTKSRKDLSRVVRKQQWRQRVADRLVPDLEQVADIGCTERVLKPWKSYRC